MYSSQHHVTVGLRFIDAFNRGDLDACLELVHPEVEWHTSDQFLEAAVHRGRRDVRVYLESLTEHLEDERMEPEDGLQIGHHVMLINLLRGKGTFLGHDISEPHNWVIRMEGEQFRQVVAYPTAADARRALEVAAARN